MNELESLRRLTEAVETAKADIAPTYIEYVHLAFAIATDCGEEGRDFFHRLCRVSAKYQREHAERIFSNALTANHGDMHLGTVFYLAEAAGVTSAKRRLQTAGQVQKVQQVQRKNFPHTRARVIRYTIARVRSLRNCCRVANPNSRYPPFRQPTGRNSCNVL